MYIRVRVWRVHSVLEAGRGRGGGEGEGAKISAEIKGKTQLREVSWKHVWVVRDRWSE